MICLILKGVAMMVLYVSLHYCHQHRHGRHRLLLILMVARVVPSMLASRLCERAPIMQLGPNNIHLNARQLHPFRVFSLLSIFFVGLDKISTKIAGLAFLNSPSSLPSLLLFLLDHHQLHLELLT